MLRNTSHKLSLQLCVGESACAEREKNEKSNAEWFYDDERKVCVLIVNVAMYECMSGCSNVLIFL